jgi:ribosome-associated protein
MVQGVSPPDDEDEPQTRRMIARQLVRRAGDRSAELAQTLMKLPDSALGKLRLDDDVREVATRARKVTALVARRREERALAGALRRIDLGDLAEQIATVQAHGVADQRPVRLAERWRARLLEEGGAAMTELCATYPAAASLGLAGMVASARAEQTTGKPKGAGRALFRALVPLFQVTSDDDE